MRLCMEMFFPGWWTRHKLLSMNWIVLTSSPTLLSLSTCTMCPKCTLRKLKSKRLNLTPSKKKTKDKSRSRLKTSCADVLREKPSVRLRRKRDCARKSELNSLKRELPKTGFFLKIWLTSMDMARKMEVSLLVWSEDSLASWWLPSMWFLNTTLVWTDLESHHIEQEHLRIPDQRLLSLRGLVTSLQDLDKPKRALVWFWTLLSCSHSFTTTSMRDWSLTACWCKLTHSLRLSSTLLKSQWT